MSDKFKELCREVEEEEEEEEEQEEEEEHQESTLFVQALGEITKIGFPPY